MENNIKETNHVLIALGIADYDESNDKSYQSVFERADKTMYQRKYEQKRLKNNLTPKC